MNVSDVAPSVALSVAALERIDRICLGFEEVLRRGDVPRIEDCLHQAADAERARLLYELLLLEFDYHSHGDRTPSLGEYRLRFPHDVTVVETAFERLSASTVGPVSIDEQQGDQVPSLIGHFQLFDPRHEPAGCQFRHAACTVRGGA